MYNLGSYGGGLVGTLVTGVPLGGGAIAITLGLGLELAGLVRIGGTSND